MIVVLMAVLVAAAGEPTPVDGAPPATPATEEAPAGEAPVGEAPAPVEAAPAPVGAAPPPSPEPADAAPPSEGASYPASAPRGGTTIALSAAGGFDFTTHQPWLGLDLAFQPDQRRGFAFAGRFQAGWGFGDQRPLGVLQAGFAGVVPAESALIRLGLLAHAEWYVVDYPIPLQIGGTPEEGTFGHLGFYPGGMLLAELGWERAATRGAAAWSIGLRLGIAPVSAVIDCDDVATAAVEETCITARIGIIGGITARLRFHEGVYLEAIGGPSPMLSFGYAFPAGGRRGR